MRNKGRRQWSERNKEVERNVRGEEEKGSFIFLVKAKPHVC
jgi:hypothetical protein